MLPLTNVFDLMRGVGIIFGQQAMFAVEQLRCAAPSQSRIRPGCATAFCSGIGLFGDGIERNAVDQFHHYVVRADVVHLTEIRMIEGRDCTGRSVGFGTAQEGASGLVRLVTAGVSSSSPESSGSFRWEK